MIHEAGGPGPRTTPPPYPEDPPCPECGEPVVDGKCANCGWVYEPDEFPDDPPDWLWP